MKIPCPECGKNLSVGDDFAGRRVKCPGCQHVFPVPVPDEEAVAVSVKPIAAKKPAAPPPPAALKKGAPPAPASRRCPECGAALTAGGAECSACDWSAEEIPAKKPRRSSREDDEGCCYIRIRKDEVELTEAVEKRLEKLIETEQLDMQIMDRAERAPEELGPNDVVISGKVMRCDYGSQFLRYFFTFVTIFGPGSCRLDVEADVETGDGEIHPVKSQTKQAIGLLGGTGAGLMKINVKVSAARIAAAAARRITGRRFLNLHVYHCAYWSLGLGFAAFIPFLGVIFALISLIVGGIALLQINSRSLPRGKVPAIAGILLSLFGIFISAAIVLVQVFNN